MHIEKRQCLQRSSAIDVLERPRLFELLDPLSRNVVVWLVAAGGYGKTTLAISYACARNLPIIWLSTHESGLSIGEFFYKLRQAAIAVLGPDAESLPVLSPEYSGASEIFVRQFAEQLNGFQQEPVMLLLDDLHNLPEDHPLHALISLLAESVGGNIRVFIASRHEPTPAWVKLRSQGRIAFIDEQRLAFVQEETAELLSRHGLPAAAIKKLLPELEVGAKGWAVGLMLLLEHWRRTGQLPVHIKQERSLAEWFLQEVYEPLVEKDRALLRSCALPDLVPVGAAETATGLDKADEKLEHLAHRHAFIFIDTDDQGGRYFRFHDLFRDFLRRRMQAEEPEATIRVQNQRWGRVLWQQGWWSIGAPLLISADDRQGLGEGIKQAAPTLLQTGCGDKLYAWLQALPEQERRAEPELRLWEGMCLILHSTVHARALLSSAWDELAEQRDYVHMAIAWSGIVDSIWLEWAHVSEYERWITEFLRFENEFRAHLPPSLWYSVLRGMLTAISYGRPTDPALERWEREALAALSASDMLDTERVMLASQLMYLNTWQFGRRSGASRVMTLMQGQQDAIERASPLARCLWQTFTSLWAFLFEADHETCLREAEEGRELIRSYGIGTWDNAVPPVHCALAFGDQAALEEWTTWFLRTEPKAHRPFYDTFQAHFLSARAWLQGELQEALDHAREAVTVADRHGSINISALFHGIYAALLAEKGKFLPALAESREARKQRKRLPSDFVEVALFLCLAKIPLLRGQPRRVLPYLRRAFEAGERQRLFIPLFIHNEELSTMCALALSEGITPEYARWLIEARNLKPPVEPFLRLFWPWSCHINVLGRFTIETQRKSGDQGGGVKRRSRELLSNLVLAGPKGLAHEEMAARFSPDSEPEQALNSLYVALHRLRHGVLGDPDAIVSDSGYIRLNPNRVRVDAWEFLQLAARPERAIPLAALQKALSLYEGKAQLQGVDEIELETWQIKLATVYEAGAIRVANHLERKNPAAALHAYQQALTNAPLSEPLWSGVLRCQAALGDQVALRRSFNLLNKRYQHDTDTAPPPELEQLYHSLAESLSSAKRNLDFVS